MMIIKFGGSIITDKAKKGIYNSTITKQLIDELHRFYEEEQTKSENSNSPAAEGDIDYNLILVHGAGSFGHISAKKYRLDEGYQEKEQLFGLSEVHCDVRDLNLKFMNELLVSGFPGISIPPMVILRNRAKLVNYFDSEIFHRVLATHCIPVTFGDVVFDEVGTFNVTFAVADNDGDISSDTVTINVDEPSSDGNGGGGYSFCFISSLQ